MPSRSQVVGIHAPASRMSSIAPSTRSRFVVSTRSLLLIGSVDGKIVVEVRSRNVEEPRLSTHAFSGIAPKTTGYRAVVVRSIPPDDDTERYSGSIWKLTRRVPIIASVAGFTGDNGSTSAIAPPVPHARGLSCPAGNPKPRVLRAACPDATLASAAVKLNATPARIDRVILEARCWFPAPRRSQASGRTLAVPPSRRNRFRREAAPPTHSACRSHWD